MRFASNSRTFARCSSKTLPSRPRVGEILREGIHARALRCYVFAASGRCGHSGRGFRPDSRCDVPISKDVAESGLHLPRQRKRCAREARDVRRARSRLHELAGQVAHRTDAEPPTVTWGRLYQTMNRVFDTYARFYFLLVGGVFVSRYPEPQYDWLHPFTIPFVPKGFTPWEKPDEPDEIK
jgi:hypothetical protein